MPRASALLLVILTSACGGFYKTGKPHTIKSTQGGGALDYVTARVSLTNIDAFFSKSYQGERKGKLSLLYVTAKYQHPVRGEQSIPLFFVDLNKQITGSVSQDALIRVLPLRPEVGATNLMTINTRAVTKSYADTALAVWDLTKDLATKLGAGLGAPPEVFATLNTAAAALEKVAATEWSASDGFAVPDATSEHVYQFFFILPTDSRNQIVPAYAAKVDAVLNAAPAACPDPGGAVHLCVSGSEVRDLPYVAIDNHFTAYAALSDLLPLPEGDCSNITRARVDSAARLINDGFSLSPNQAKLEGDLIAAATVLLRLQEAVQNSNWKDAIDQYWRFAELKPEDRSPLFESRGKTRFEGLRACARTAFNKYTFFDAVEFVVPELTPDLKLDAPPAMLDASLAKLQTCTTYSAEKAFAPALDSLLFQRCSGRIMSIESSLYAGLFEGDVKRLRFGTLKKDEGLALSKALLDRASQFHCGKCRLETLAATTEFASKNASSAEAQGLAANETNVNARSRLGELVTAYQALGSRDLKPVAEVRAKYGKDIKFLLAHPVSGKKALWSVPGQPDQLFDLAQKIVRDDRG